MSFIYNPRTRRPQVWTYPFFVFVVCGIVYGFYAYGEKKAAERVQLPVNAEADRQF